MVTVVYINTGALNRILIYEQDVLMKEMSQNGCLHFCAPLNRDLSFGVSPTSRILAPASSYKQNN